MINGTRTEIFTDVKSPIFAGMGKLKNGQNVNKLSKIGYDLVRLYYDCSLKNCLVGEERIKGVINK